MGKDAESEAGFIEAATLEVTDLASSGVHLLERGVPAKSTLRGALGRFFPASILSMGSVLAMMPGLGWSSLLEFFGGVLLGAGLLTIGFGVGLEGLRRWLTEDAGVDGRRSVLAGLLSPLALFISAVFLQGLGAVEGLLCLFFVGMVMAVAIFFPWLAGDKGSDRLNEIDRSLVPGSGSPGKEDDFG